MPRMGPTTHSMITHVTVPGNQRVGNKVSSCSGMRAHAAQPRGLGEWPRHTGPIKIIDAREDHASGPSTRVWGHRNGNPAHEAEGGGELCLREDELSESLVPSLQPVGVSRRYK